jgi:peptidyl-prolyl cis-trans isomerase B (cyclophilin B)
MYLKSIFCAQLAAFTLVASVAMAEEEATPAEPATPTQQENPVVILKTNKGDIKIELFEQDAPITVENFLKYVDDGHYAGTIFHRVIPGFMIQGGGFDESMSQKNMRSPIKNEAANGKRNDRGTLAMARTGVVDSATSQFFINLIDNAFLNYSGPSPQRFGYCVFGQVIEGMEVVDQIAAVRTGRSGPHENVPTESVIIIEAVRAN